MNQQWQVNSSGIVAAPEPIPLSFSVPTGYSQTLAGGPNLVGRSRVQFQMSPPVSIPKDCNCFLTSASFTFSQPNVAPVGAVPGITTGNNRITIAFGGGPSVDYTVPLGLYSLTDMQLALNQIARDQGWLATAGDLFILTGISATQKVIFSLNPAPLFGAVFPVGGIVISFANPGVAGLNNSMGPLLGFPTAGAGSTFTAPGTAPFNAQIFSQPAPNVANFANISAYNLYVSFLKNSYQNGSTGQLLYSFPIGAYAPNSVVAFQPSLSFPVQCASNSYSTIEIWTTDQAGNELPWEYYQSPFAFSCLISKNKPNGSL